MTDTNYSGDNLQQIQVTEDTSDSGDKLQPDTSDSGDKLQHITDTTDVCTADTIVTAEM